MLTVKTTKFSLQYVAIAAAFGMSAMLTGCCSTCSTPATNFGTCVPNCGDEGCGSTPGLMPACASTGCGVTSLGSDTTCAPQMCGTVGCTTGSCGDICSTGYGCNVPCELQKTALPEYRIEPPDVLLIEAVNNLRPVDSPIGAGEPLIIQVNRTLPALDTEDRVSQAFKKIDGPYIVGTDGYVNLGPEYGKVLCVGQPLEEIQRRIEVHLNRILKSPQVLVTLPDPTAKQIVAGEHLVRPDGTVGLGIYGGVFVAGKTLRDAKAAIEAHLSEFMHAPEIAIDVLGYNSKVYYVIADGGGAGEQVHRLPCTGNETVLDAISQINGLPTVANKGQIWVARPSGQCNGMDQVLQVDWNAIAQGAQTCTNYQILPGDRLYVKADRCIVFDTQLGKVMAPFERILGIASLGRFASGGNNN
jgi:polysaccharide export outer membrane protein